MRRAVVALLGILLLSQPALTQPITGDGLNAITANAQALHKVSRWAGSLNGYQANEFDISSDQASLGRNFGLGLYVQQKFGGGGASGGRSGIWVDTRNDGGATASTNINRNYIGVTGHSWAVSSDGGTAPSAAKSKGAFFGLNGVGVALSGATNLRNVTGAEFNTTLQAGSSVAAKSVIQLSGESNDAVSGSVVDTMVWLVGQAGSVGFNDGILFDPQTAFGGQWPIKSTGNLIRTAGGTVQNGIDISATTITGNAFKSPGFAVSGDGIVQLGAFAVASLPTCSADNAGSLAYVTDAKAPTYNGALTGGGTVKTLTVCNGTAWTAH